VETQIVYRVCLKTIIKDDKVENTVLLDVKCRVHHITDFESPEGE
jgi:hypothetical protein